MTKAQPFTETLDWLASSYRETVMMILRRHLGIAKLLDQPGVFVPPTYVSPQLASGRASGAGGCPPRLLCGRTVLECLPQRSVMICASLSV